MESLLEQERSLKAELEALEEQNTEKKNSLKQFNDHLSQVQHILGETLKSPMPRTTELDVRDQIALNDTQKQPIFTHILNI